MHLCKCHECMGWLLGRLLCRGLPGLAGPRLLIKLASLWRIGLFKLHVPQGSLLRRRAVLSTTAAAEICPAPLAVTVTWSWASAPRSLASW